MKIKSMALTVMLLVTGLLGSGCALFLIGAGVAAGAGTVAYMNGELKAADEVTLDRGWNAAVRAMGDLQFKVTTTQKDALAGKLVAHRADDTRITILLKKQSDTVTEFRIRVGVFGDENLSRLIYEKIKKHF
jgi:hypothetical protein